MSSSFNITSQFFISVELKPCPWHTCICNGSYGATHYKYCNASLNWVVNISWTSFTKHTHRNFVWNISASGHNYTLTLTVDQTHKITFYSRKISSRLELCSKGPDKKNSLIHRYSNILLYHCLCCKKFNCCT